MSGKLCGVTFVEIVGYSALLHLECAGFEESELFARNGVPRCISGHSVETALCANRQLKPHLAKLANS